MENFFKMVWGLFPKWLKVIVISLVILYLPLFFLQYFLVKAYLLTFHQQPKFDELLIKIFTENPQNGWWVAIIITLNILYWVIILFLFMKPYLKFRSKEVPIDIDGNKIIAKLVRQDDVTRKKMFTDINALVENSYQVYGMGLTSISNQESMITSFIDKGVDVELCMMNPDMFRVDVCETSIKENECGLAKIIKDKLEESEDSIAEYITLIGCRYEHDILAENKILIHPASMQEYLSSMTDYYSNLAQSHTNICKIKEGLKESHPSQSEKFKFKEIKSFVPISMTIVDAKKDDGELLVEHLLPFTKERLLLHIKKKDNGKVFASYVDTYTRITKDAKNVESEETDE